MNERFTIFAAEIAKKIVEQEEAFAKVGINLSRLNGEEIGGHVAFVSGQISSMAQDLIAEYRSAMQSGGEAPVNDVELQQIEKELPFTKMYKEVIRQVGIILDSREA